MTPLLQKKVSAPNIDAASSSAESLNELKDPPHYYFFLDGKYIFYKRNK